MEYFSKIKSLSTFSKVLVLFWGVLIRKPPWVPVLTTPPLVQGYSGIFSLRVEQIISLHNYELLNNETSFIS